MDVVSSPESQLRIADRYLRANDAKRVGWDELIDDGRRLPEPTKACERSWRASGKDRRIDWSSASHLCMSGLLGGAYKPQGVGGSATTEHYQIDGLPAAERNLVLTSWYSRSAERGLFAANGAGESVTRLVVMDMDQSRYNTVELVRPGANGKLDNLNSHGSGLVWAGQYLYSSSHSELWMYNADDILKVDGRYVLPAVGRWRVTGLGGLSSLSLDQIDRADPPGRHRLLEGRAGHAAELRSRRRRTGGWPTVRRRPVRTSSWPTPSVRGPGGAQRQLRRAIPGSSFQGIARYGPYTLRQLVGPALRRAGGRCDRRDAGRPGDRPVPDAARQRAVDLHRLPARATTSASPRPAASSCIELPLTQLVGTDGS